MPKSKASSSKHAVPASGDVLGFDPNWCIPFISVLESKQHEWNSLVRQKDNDGRQEFLRRRRDSLTEWAEEQGLSEQLPQNLKTVYLHFACCFQYPLITQPGNRFIFQRSPTPARTEGQAQPEGQHHAKKNQGHLSTRGCHQEDVCPTCQGSDTGNI